MIKPIKSMLWTMLMSVLLAAGVPNANANPDVWVTTRLTYQFGDSKLTGLKFNWQFDEYFSSHSIQRYDTNHSGRLEPVEVQHLRTEAFDPLSRFDYYVHLWVNGEKRAGLTITDFSAFIDDVHLVYQFSVALLPPAPVNPNAGIITASLYDPKTVVDFRISKERFLLVEGTRPAHCKFRIARGKGAQTGQPQVVTLNCGV